MKHITKIPNKAAHGGTTIHTPQASTSASLTGRFNILFPNNLTYAFISCLRKMKCFFFKNFKCFLSFFYSCVLGCVGSLLLCMLFSSCREQGIPSSCGSRASHRSGPSCNGVLALGHAGFSSCSARGSVAVVPGLSSRGSIVVAQRLCCSAACGIFPDQGWNLCLLH